MAKFAPTVVLDSPLDIVATATEMYPCAGQPATRAAAIAASACAAIVMAPGDFAKSAAGTGRKLTVAAKAATANAAVTADHIALCTATTLLFITTCPAQAITVGGAITVATFDITDPQPV